MNTTSISYTLRAKFISKDGSGRVAYSTTRGLSLETALDKKTALLERVSHCVSASVTPETKATKGRN